MTAWLRLGRWVARVRSPANPSGGARWSRSGAWALLGLVSVSLACTTAPPPGALRTTDAHLTLCDSAEAADHEIALTYLGTGGFLLRSGDAALLTAPFYSNPDVLRVGLGFTLVPDRERIDALLPDQDALGRVRAVLVGHAHYDHAMDLSVVLERLPPVPVYGSQTLSHLLAKEIPESRRIVLDERAADRTGPGEWIPIPESPFRILPIRSDHGPQIGRFLELFGGQVEGDASIPRSAYGWKQGLSLAYLIDVLRSDGSVALRFHYQDAASHFPLGAPPESERRRVDVAVVCVGAFAGVKDYPQALLDDTKPLHIVLGHWEDFFRDPALPLRVVRANSLPAFLRRIQPAIERGSAFTLPDRDVTMRFRPCRRDSE